MLSTFDTRASIRELVAAGFPVEPAKAIVAVVAKSGSAIASEAERDAAISRPKAKPDRPVARLDAKKVRAGADLLAKSPPPASRYDLLPCDIRLMRKSFFVAVVCTILLFIALRLT